MFRNEDVRKLNTVILNEMFAPELLMYEEKLIGDLMEQLVHQEKRIEQKKTESSEACFRCVFYELEIQEIKYLLEKYLRTRLLKIEKYLFWINWRVDGMKNLSSQESVYVKAEIENHLLFVEELEEESSIPAKRFLHALINETPRPDYEQSVFLKTGDGFVETVLEADGGIDVGQNEILFIQYKSIKKLLEESTETYLI